ncbi:aminopeptidase P family protein [Paenibacillus silagei]|uniref:Xaa-Pro aminopeptidase n=1 Tax=Paenibacillus silagei TaxID=1670801 RepID=A0ABS4NY55_9BACL|nr:aminopeptidase P family protein [Paenibacillus silagei]MBP2114411.1 Xaa-Pro aminopeptidase [Paenibacillus silagei]
MLPKEKVHKLREWMAERGIAACVVLSGDAHISEYEGEHWKSRRWITGFTGSAGTAVITLTDAGLWTDGRYYIQAERELEGSGIRLFRMAEPGVPQWDEWLAEQLPQGACMAVDGRTLSVSAMKGLQAKLAEKGIQAITDLDPVGAIWTDRPAIPAEPLMLHDEQYAGLSRVDKLEQVRQAMKRKGADYYVLAALDDLCWLFNIRGRDIPFNPYVTAFAAVGVHHAILFAGGHKATPEDKETLARDGVEIKEYDDILPFLQTLPEAASVLYDPNKTGYSLAAAIPESASIMEAPGLVVALKSIKNEVEIRNIRDVYLKDAVALVGLFKWLQETVPVRPVTEVEADQKGLELRRQQPLFAELSFSSISAYGANAAMMHYSPSADHLVLLEAKGLYLLDSGSHFLNGTTDITRTLVLGALTDEEKRDFTLVLKSVIALSTAKFLYGSTGSTLDILARKPMWDHGLDYKCGTGHGVGYYSNVHEEPQRFSFKPNEVRLEPGMIITVEPGVYKEGRHGIRTENTLLITEDVTTEFGRFLKFEDLCYLPIDLRAIEPSMLSSEELEWVNHYHAEVYDKLAPLLDEEHRLWLKRETGALVL